MAQILLHTLPIYHLHALSDLRDRTWRKLDAGDAKEGVFDLCMETDAEAHRRSWSGMGGTSEPPPRPYVCSVDELSQALAEYPKELLEP